MKKNRKTFVRRVLYAMKVAAKGKTIPMDFDLDNCTVSMRKEKYKVTDREWNRIIREIFKGDQLGPPAW